MKKQIQDYENLYEITDHGEVWSVYKNRFLRNSLNKDGYIQTVLYKKDKKPQHFLVHILVANHFLEIDENRLEINHKDCNKLNNDYTNLERCTRQENMDHAKQNGLIKKEHLIGNKHACSKLRNGQESFYFVTP